MNRAKDIAALALIVLAYLGYFAADSRSPDFAYALNASIPAEAFDTLDSFSVDHFIAPWRYRLVPRLLQWWVFAAVRQLALVPFLSVALALSAIFGATAFALFYWLLRNFDLNVGWALFGCALAMSSFPVVFGYRVRNWMTLDDVLAWALVGAGLLLLLRGAGRTGGWFVVVSVLAALARETTLLLGVVVLFDRRIPVARRVALALPSGLAFLAIRLLLFETSEVTTAAGMPVPRLGLNLVEEGVVLTSAYAFAVFGVGWLLALLGWLDLYRRRASLDDRLWLLWITTPAAVSLLGGFNLLIGSIRENRILFLVFPWVLGMATLYVSRRWREFVTRAAARRIALVLGALAAPAVLFLLLVPGGSGARLAALLRVPGLAFAHEAIWLSFYYRFNWIDGQMEHVLVHIGLTGVALLWLVAARLPPARRALYSIL